MNISACPRCGCPSLEHLVTHSSCLECGYSPDVDSDLNTWERLEMTAVRRCPDSKWWILRRDHRPFGVFA